jgi:hypothetical protein
MLARSRILFKLINDKNKDMDIDRNFEITNLVNDSERVNRTSQSDEKHKSKTSKELEGPMSAPLSEEIVKTPQQEFKEIIKLANKKVSGNKKKDKLRKKVIDKLLEFMEEQYMPLAVDEAEIF